MKTSYKIAIALSALFSVNAVACEFHDNPMFGRFGHPLMKQHKQAQQPSYLSLKIEPRVSAPAQQSAVLDIDYYSPMEYRDVKLSFSCTPGLEIDQLESVALNGVQGRYQLNYKAIEPGQHQIHVRVEGTKGDIPYSQLRKIQVLAY